MASGGFYVKCANCGRIVMVGADIHPSQISREKEGMITDCKYCRINQ